MKQEYKFAISGIRFHLKTQEDLFDLSSLFFSLVSFIKEQLKKKDLPLFVALAYDSRLTSKCLKEYFEFLFNLNDLLLLNYGCLPTPSFLFAVKNSKASFGIMITASHNPIEWNGLKLLSEFGEFVDQDFLDEFKDFHLKNTWKQKVLNASSDFFQQNSFLYLKLHVEKILNYLEPYLDYQAIREKKISLVYDPANGPVNFLVPLVFDFFNCTYIAVNDSLGNSKRNPEPCLENLSLLEQKVQETQSDLGLAFDMDGDRLVFLSKGGEYLGEEYTLFLALYEYLTVFPLSDFVVNLSSSRLFDDLAQFFKVKVYRTAVGEKNIINEMKKRSLPIGGEGNGGMIFLPLCSSRDPLISLLLIFNLFAKIHTPIAHFIRNLQFQSYNFFKEKIPFNLNKKHNFDLIKDKILKEFQKKEEGKFNLIDGIRFDGPNYWFHLRISNTENCYRLFIEVQKDDLGFKKRQEIHDFILSLFE